MIRNVVAAILAVIFSCMPMPALVRDFARIALERPVVDVLVANVDAQSADALHVDQTMFGYHAVKVGEILTLSYRLENTSDRIIVSYQIADPALVSDSAKSSALEPGQSAVISMRFPMDAIEKHSTPILTYQFEGEETEYTKKLEPTDFYAEAGIAVTIQIEPIVYAGDRVDFYYTIVNATEMALTDIRIADEVLGDIETNLSLNPGNTYHGTKSVTITDTVTFRLTVTGTDTEGNNITFMSNEATVQTADRAE